MLNADKKLLRGVSEAHLKVMRVLYEKGRTNKKIANAVGISEVQCQDIITRMEGLGWIRLTNTNP